MEFFLSFIISILFLPYGFFSWQLKKKIYKIGLFLFLTKITILNFVWFCFPTCEIRFQERKETKKMSKKLVNKISDQPLPRAALVFLRKIFTTKIDTNLWVCVPKFLRHISIVFYVRFGSISGTMKHSSCRVVCFLAFHIAGLALLQTFKQHLCRRLFQLLQRKRNIYK